MEPALGSVTVTMSGATSRGARGAAGWGGPTGPAGALLPEARIPRRTPRAASRTHSHDGGAEPGGPVTWAGARRIANLALVATPSGGSIPALDALLNGNRVGFSTTTLAASSSARPRSQRSTRSSAVSSTSRRSGFPPSAT